MLALISDVDGIKHYWCVNCGKYGTFKAIRYRGAHCPSCHYEELTKLDEQEFEEAAKIRPWILENKTYEEWTGKKSLDKQRK
jgi:DNA-directed RNA polymerase subunit RPC12/RpoP